MNPSFIIRWLHIQRNSRRLVDHPPTKLIAAGRLQASELYSNSTRPVHAPTDTQNSILINLLLQKWSFFRTAATAAIRTEKWHAAGQLV